MARSSARTPGARPGVRAAVRHAVGGQPGDAAERRVLFREGVALLDEGGGGQDDAGPAARRDARQAGVRLVPPGRVGGHRHHAGVQAAEEADEELDARRVAQDRPLAPQPAIDQHRGHGPRPPVEVRQRQPLLAVVAPGLEAEAVVGPLRRPLAEEFDQVGDTSVLGANRRHRGSRPCCQRHGPPRRHRPVSLQDIRQTGGYVLKEIVAACPDCPAYHLAGSDPFLIRGSERAPMSSRVQMRRSPAVVTPGQDFSRGVGRVERGSARSFLHYSR